jgi:lipopolysaccharide transport system ATP-binding protein
VPDQAINTYNFLLAKKGKGEEVRIIDQSDRINSYGNQKVEIIGIHLLNTKYHETELFMSGERCIINVSIKTTQPTDDITVGVLIRDRFGQDIFGTNTHHLRTPIQLDTGKSAKISYVIATRYSMR